MADQTLMESNSQIHDKGGTFTPPNLSIDHILPSPVITTILTNLDVRSICSAATTCTSLRLCASHALSFIPNFHITDIAPSLDLLRPLMPLNKYLKSLKLDCAKLDDSAIELFVRTSLSELYLHNCEGLSGKLLFEVGDKCRDLRTLYLGALAERRRLVLQISDLEKLLSGCVQLEILSLGLDVSTFNPSKFAEVWATASEKLTSLEIAYIPMTMLNELLSSVIDSHQPQHTMKKPMFLSLQKLCLSVDCITDFLIDSISRGLPSLTHIDLQDAPLLEPTQASDLTNSGLQQINLHGKLKHISLIRSQEFLSTYFRRVNDLGMFLMVNTCSTLESISLGGFCRVTDSGFREILHFCSNLRKLRISHGSQLTDLLFHDISATSLSLTHVSLRWCNLLTNPGIAKLSFNKDLTVLDLRDCRKLSDGSLSALSSLSKLEKLLLDGTDISDHGLSYLGQGKCQLISLSLRGCRKLTNACISSIFHSSSLSSLQILDLSKIPNFSDDGIFLLAKSRVPIVELRIRECPYIGDASVMALASMQVEGGSHGSSLQLLDLYDSGGITPLSFRWFKRPYFPRLRWLGVNGSVNRDMVDALARARPFLHVECRGEELGMGYWDTLNGWYRHEEDEVDELEQWLLEGDDGSDEEEMEEG